jgi:hypothetical protein
MHHTLDKLAPAFPQPPLAGLRNRADLNDEIASENRAIARIEENIGAPVSLPTCAYCPAIAQADCVACDDGLCEDDAVWKGSQPFCPECVGLRP